MAVDKFGKPLEEEEEQQSQSQPQLSAEALQQIRQGAQAEVYGALQNDPEIGQILRLRAAGKKPQVTEAGVERPESSASSQHAAPPASVDLSKMSEAEKMKYFVDQVRAETVKVVGEQLKPIDQRLNAIEGFGQEIKKNDVVAQVAAVKKKYGESEFESLKPQMAALLTENPNLSAENLFLLAAAQAGRFVQAPRRTTSEKPSSTTSRPHERREPARPGVGGMRELLSGATSKVFERVSGQNGNSFDEE